MTTEPKLETAGLLKLALAPENARFGRPYGKDELKALAASIEAVGRLLHPLSGYRTPDSDVIQIWDGGRRLAAIQALYESLPKKSPVKAYLQAGVPVLVDDTNDRARLHSMATFVRQAMHPADEFLAYNEMFDAGQDHGEIAAACAVSTLRVRQLLRLRGVAPEILQAFRDGKLALDMVEAFTLSDDHARQLKVFGQLNKNWRAWDVKSHLQEGAVGAHDAWAQFVGLKAYEAAGGRLLVDLFSNREDADWADGALVTRLATEKMHAMVTKVKAEGWEFVEHIAPNRSYSFDNGYAREGDKKAWTPEFKATAGVFIVLDYNGHAEVRRGYFRAKGTGTGEAAKPKTRAQENPALYGFSHVGHLTMTAVATHAARVGLIRKPEAAYDALLTHLAWMEFRHGTSSDSASALSARAYVPNAKVAGGDEVARLHAAWAARLPNGRIALCDYVAALPADEKAQLLALCFAESLDATEGKIDMVRPARWRHLGWIARHADVDMAQAWTPDADFLKGAGKPALIEAARALGNDSPKLADAKKGELVAYVAARAAEAHWTPELLAKLTDVAPEEDKAADAAGDDDEFADLDEVGFLGAIIDRLIDVHRDVIGDDTRNVRDLGVIALNRWLGEGDDAIQFGEEGEDWTIAGAHVIADGWVEDGMPMPDLETTAEPA